MSTSIAQSSGTRLMRSPPRIRPRLIEGWSNSSEASRPDGAHHRRKTALHVVGAAADQAVAVDARLELAGPPGHDVDVAVEDDRRTVRGADRGGKDRQAAGRAVLHVDLVRLQPALDEAGGRLDPVDG